MDRNDQNAPRGVPQQEQGDRSMHGSGSDRGTPERGMQERGTSGRESPEQEGSYRSSPSDLQGDDAGRAMSADARAEGGNRSDPRVGTTANQTGSNRSRDEERMQGRPASGDWGDEGLGNQPSDDRGSVERGASDRGERGSADRGGA